YYHDIKNLMQNAGSNPTNLPNFLNPTEGNKRYGTPVPKSIFGLPNNYMSRSRRGNPRRGIGTQYPWQVSVEAIADEKFISRRSSPLLIHISRWNNGKFSWIATFLPAKFLPARALLKIVFPSKGLPQKTQDNNLLKLKQYLRNKTIKSPPPKDEDNLLFEFVKQLSNKFQKFSFIS
ncbi:MAG: hypothetical protein DRG83_08780, partial [Deltaproteobacteria bacterium]